MTRPGGSAEGMPGEFALRQRDIPRTDYHNGPGRALPHEVMTALLAATELTDWARAEATPSEEEITAMRALIRRIENHMNELTDDERAQIAEAVTVLRSTRRTVHLGMPTIPTDIRHVTTRP